MPLLLLLNENDLRCSLLKRGVLNYCGKPVEFGTRLCCRSRKVLGHRYRGRGVLTCSSAGCDPIVDADA